MRVTGIELLTEPGPFRLPPRLPGSIVAPDTATDPPQQTRHKVEHSMFLIQKLPPCAKLWLLPQANPFVSWGKGHIANKTLLHAPGRLCPLLELWMVPHHCWYIFKLWNSYASLINQLQLQKNGPRNLSESCVLLSGPFSVWQCCDLYIAQKLFNNELFGKVFNEPSLISTIHSHLSLGIASKMDYLPSGETKKVA